MLVCFIISMASPYYGKNYAGVANHHMQPCLNLWDHLMKLFRWQNQLKDTTMLQCSTVLQGVFAVK